MRLGYAARVLATCDSVSPQSSRLLIVIFAKFGGGTLFWEALESCGIRSTRKRVKVLEANDILI